MGHYSEIPVIITNETERQLQDAAKRLSDLVNNIVVFQPLDVVTHSWIAVRLSDGSYDGTLYDSRFEAVRHQTYEQQCAYVHLSQAMGGMHIREAYAFLKFHRDAYDAGLKLSDPERPNGGFDLITPITNEDVRSQIRRMRRRIHQRGR